MTRFQIIHNMFMFKSLKYFLTFKNGLMSMFVQDWAFLEPPNFFDV